MQNIKSKMQNTETDMSDRLIKEVFGHTDETREAYTYAKKARFLCEVMYNTFFTEPIREEAREREMHRISELFDIIFDYVIKAECQTACVHENAAKLHELTEKLKREEIIKGTVKSVFGSKEK